jgi:hypothetical protein
MGATTFLTYSHGRDVGEAFRRAAEEAGWQYGHGGYTGTIAEKSGWVLFELPPRWTVEKMIDLAQRLTDASREHEDAADGVLGGWVNEVALRKAERDLARVRRAAGPHLERFAAVYNDKWGPAAAVEVRGKAASAYRARRGIKRGRVFAFAGWASC